MTALPLRFFWRRANHPPLSRQPLVVRSVGHAVAPPGWQEDSRRQGYLKLQWTVAGAGEIRQNGRARRVLPGDCTWWQADREHWARAGEDGWTCWWFTLMPDCAAWPLVEVFGLVDGGTWSAGPCPQDVFRALARAATRGDAEGEEAAAALAYRLIARAARARRAGERGGLVDAALDEIERRWADPAFGVADLAAGLGTHRSRLCRQFARAVGVPPSDHLLRLRLGRAATLLRTTRLDVRVIAARCGFADASYFARAFRAAYGRAPSAHRDDPGS